MLHCERCRAAKGSLVEQATRYDAAGDPALAATFRVDLLTGHGVQLSHPKI